MSSSDDSCESQYAMTEIEYPGVHDVLCGRGGHAISHSGNVNFRMMVEKFKTKYASASRYEKAKVIGEVVRMWRSQSPPGRFLIITDPSKGESSKWHDIGDNAANKKVAQCLRERNPRAEYTAGQTPATNAAVAAAAATDSATSTATPLPMAATSSAAAAVAVAVAAFPTPAHRSMDWKRRKSSKKQKQRKQEVQPGKRQETKSKSAVAHQQQHPKHQGQRQKQQQNAHNRHQHALKKKAQKQVQMAEQEVWQAQQQVNQQAHELQNALMQRAQQEAAAAAATQVVLNQMALQQVEQEIWKEQNLVNQKMQPQQQGQQQQQQQQQQVHFQDQPQVHFEDQPQQQVHFQEQPMEDDEFQQKASQLHPVNNHNVAGQGTQESASDTMSSLDSPLMWDDCQGISCNSNGPLSPRDSMAREMPSAARLTKNVFDDDTNNGSSDSSTATSGRMAKVIYSKLDTFSDTTSENSNDNFANGDSNDGAISDGSNSIARPDAYPPD